MTSAAAPAAAAADRNSFIRLLLAAWLAASFVSLVVHFQTYRQLRHVRSGRSPPARAGAGLDRRPELVRRLQHRMNPPVGGDMHWSRIVDLPLAAGILLLTPLFGAHLAETVTLTLVPLLLLGATMAAVAVAARPLLGSSGGLLAAVLVMLMPSLVHQLGPMRIDHHGWQIAMGASCLAALVAGQGWRSGVAAGIAASAWVHVSAEALPYIGAIGALLGVRYLLSEDEKLRFLSYLASLAGCSLALFLLTRPSAEWAVPKCDALSAPFLLPFLAAAALAGAGAMLPLARFLWGRAIVLGVAGAGAALLLVKVGGACAGGPFGTLEPIVRSFWYLNVLEGLPIWQQRLPTLIGIVWTPLIGAVGTFYGWRAAKGREAAAWASVALLLASATGVALLVQRAEALAHLYALPGCAWLLVTLLRRVARLSQAAARIPLTVMVFLMPSPAAAMIGGTFLDPSALVPSDEEAPEVGSCSQARDFAGLAGLPAVPGPGPDRHGPGIARSDATQCHGSRAIIATTRRCVTSSSPSWVQRSARARSLKRGASP
jgi:hypothetical protein